MHHNCPATIPLLPAARSSPPPLEARGSSTRGRHLCTYGILLCRRLLPTFRSSQGSAKAPRRGISSNLKKLGAKRVHRKTVRRKMTNSKWISKSPPKAILSL